LSGPSHQDVLAPIPVLELRPPIFPHDPANHRVEELSASRGATAQDLITCRRAAGLTVTASWGLDLLFDDNSYTEMFNALRLGPQ